MPVYNITYQNPFRSDCNTPNNKTTVRLKQIMTAIHFALLAGIFISVIVVPPKCQYFIIAAAITWVIAIAIPPRGMLKPDQAAPHWLEKNEAAAKGKKE